MVATFCTPEETWLLSLESNIFIGKEVLGKDKNQIQVGQVNALKPGHTEDGLLLQFRKKM